MDRVGKLKRRGAKFIAFVTLAACCALGAAACSYLPKTENSIDPFEGNVKSTAVIKTNPPRKPLD